MTDELKIWALRTGNEVEPIPNTSSVDLEGILEDTLVQRPEMLENGLQLVGRQTPTEGGPLDLLGVDAGGRLVVFELKREKVTREAVTQCIDYASALNAKAPEELAAFIAKHSGQGGVDKIEDFEEWYDDSFEENNLDDLIPPRLVLVGLGVDERAERMVRFLSEGGIDISMLTFHGFEHAGESLLARQVEVERDDTPAAGRRTSLSAAERRHTFESSLAERGLTELFSKISATVQGALADATPRYGQNGVGYRLPTDNGTRRICHVWLARDGGLSVVWHPPRGMHSQDETEQLLAMARTHGWGPVDRAERHGLIIEDIEQLSERREGLTAFLKAARAAWSPAPQDGDSSTEEERE